MRSYKGQIAVSPQNSYDIYQIKNKIRGRHSIHEDVLNFRNNQIYSHKRNQTQITDQLNQINLQSKLSNAEHKITKYKQTIKNLQDTIEGLQKLNQQLAKQSKQNIIQLEQFANKMKIQMELKQKQIYNLEQQLKKLRMSDVESLDQSIQSIHNLRKFTKSLQFKIDTTFTNKPTYIQNNQQQQLREQNQKLRQNNNKINKQLQQLQLQLLQANKKIQILNLQKQQIHKNVQNLQFYQKIIQEKESTIKKMSQFNNQICLKLIHINNKHNNQQKQINSKQQSQQIEELKKQNKYHTINIHTLEQKNKNLTLQLQQLNKKNTKFTKQNNQQLYYVIQEQKRIIYKKECQIQALKSYLSANKSNNQNFHVVQSYMTAYQSNVQNTNIKQQKSQSQSNLIDIQKLISQINYWKNKSKSLWELLKNVQQEQNCYDKKMFFQQNSLSRVPSKVLHKSSTVYPKKQTIYPRSSLYHLSNGNIQDDIVNQKIKFRNSRVLLQNEYCQFEQIQTNQGTQLLHLRDYKQQNRTKSNSKKKNLLIQVEQQQQYINPPLILNRKSSGLTQNKSNDQILSKKRISNLKKSQHPLFNQKIILITQNRQTFKQNINQMKLSGFDD